MEVKEQAERAKEASYRLLSLSRKTKDEALGRIAAKLSQSRQRILEENRQDLDEAQSQGLASALLKRLELTDRKIEQMIQGIQDLVRLDDPVGKRIETTQLDDGLVLYKVATPIGLIGVIFESRPDALIQIGTLCLKSGNAVILKGGSEAKRSNRILFGLMREAAQEVDEAFKDALQLVETRKEIAELLKLDQVIDLMIPRGSSSLVRYIQERTKIPVLGHAEGICHLYVDKDADLAMAVNVARDAKCQYPAVCNAVETLLVHEGVAESFLKKLQPVLTEVELRGDERARALIPMKAASESDWRAEYNDLILSVKVVSSQAEAVDHINRYGSHHTDAIITENREAAEEFMNRVDSSSVMWNCSTRFADGFRYGFGAEVGISTAKIHARGPVGLQGLTIYKYKLYGKGQIVAPYAEGTRELKHKQL
jgi:glutamate-5-semialdehyde dehydrogenase